MGQTDVCDRATNCCRVDHKHSPTRSQNEAMSSTAKSGIRPVHTLSPTPSGASTWLAMLNQAHLAAAVVHADLRLLAVNAIYVAARGSSAQALIGCRDLDLLPDPACVAVLDRRYSLVLKHSRPGSQPTPRSSSHGRHGNPRWLVAVLPEDQSTGPKRRRSLLLSLATPCPDEPHPPPTPTSGEDGELRFGALCERMNSAIALHEIIRDSQSVPCDFRFLHENPAYEAITGWKRSKLVGRRLCAMLPTDASHGLERFATVATNPDFRDFDDFDSSLGRDYRLTAYCADADKLTVVIDDVTASRCTLHRMLHGESRRPQFARQPASKQP